MSKNYGAKPGEDIQQGLYEFGETATLALVEDRGEKKGKRWYTVSFFPKSQPIPRSGLAQKLTPLSGPKKSEVLRDSEIPRWLNERTNGNSDLATAVGASLS